MAVTVDSREWKRAKKRLPTEIKTLLRTSMLQAFQIIGLTAVSDYMVRAHVIDGNSGYNVGTAGSSKLNIRSGRLSRSLIDQFTFTGNGGGTNESIRKVTAGAEGLEGEYGTKVPYAAIHEFGGTIQAKGGGFLHFQIGPFHFMRKSVKIPARPYLNPAYEKSMPEILILHQENLTALLTKHGVV